MLLTKYPKLNQILKYLILQNVVSINVISEIALIFLPISKRTNLRFKNSGQECVFLNKKDNSHL